MPLPMIFSPVSAQLLADRMRFLGCAELLADTFEFNTPPDFNAEAWAWRARDIAEDLKAGKAIALDDCAVALLVESLEGNRLIWQATSNRRGLIQVAAVVAKRLEPYAGRTVIPDLGPVFAEVG